VTDEEMRNNAARVLIPLPDGTWVLNCRACPKRRLRKHHYTTAEEAAAAWREHCATQAHISDPKLRRLLDYQ